MSNQPSLLPEPDLIEEAIQHAEQRGQRITPWVRHAMQSWAERGVKPPQDAQLVDRQKNKAGNSNPYSLTWLELGTTPSPCNCLDCKQPAVIFPPEDGAPLGYCICPCCSFSSLSGCPHKPQSTRQAAA